MPAKSPTPVRTRIRQMYETGERHQSIADKLGLDRKTVAKYCDKAETNQVPAAAGPAVQFAPDEVQKLRWLAAATQVTNCTRCGKALLYVTSSSGVVCPHCHSRLA